MKTLALQDNLSKVKAVEEIYQQTLRFPDDVQQSLAGQIQKIYRQRRRRVAKSPTNEGGKLQTQGKATRSEELPSRGRAADADELSEDSPRQCCIDLEA